jgi:putative Holliday junction resolvase
MRTLAIDYGSRRVGLALSDEGGRLATPYEVLEVASPRHAREQIAAVIAREGVRRLLVGIPLNMDGSTGTQARQVAEWASELASATGLELIFVDERLSSFQAEQQLIDRKRSGEKLTRKRKKQQRDALAAAGFLQAFLDGRNAPLAP